MFRLVSLRVAVCAVALASVVFVAQKSASAQDIFQAANNTATQYAAFDALSGITAIANNLGLPPVAGNTFMGNALLLDNSASVTTARNITGLDAVFANNSGAALNLTGLRLRAQFWGDALAANDPNYFVGSSALGAPIVFNFPGITAATPFAINNNTFQAVYNLNLGTPIATQFTNFVGVTLNWQGATDATGTAFGDIAGLTTLVRGGSAAPAFASGSVLAGAPTYNYLRNASGRTDFNFNSGAGNASDGRQIGNNSSLAVRVYVQGAAAVVPESNTLALLALAVPIVGAVVIRRRKK